MKLSRQLQIFLLHARQDQEAVRRMYWRLKKEGADVWLDQEKLLPGQDWVYEICNAIHNSDLVIVCLSRQFIKQGGYRHEELKIALETAETLDTGDIYIIPARLEPCDMPESLRRWQYVDLFKVDGFKKLLQALEKTVVPFR